MSLPQASISELDVTIKVLLIKRPIPCHLPFRHGHACMTISSFHSRFSYLLSNITYPRLIKDPVNLSSNSCSYTEFLIS
jgi:hypothetical protein